MTGQYIEVVNISDKGFVYLSNRDIIYYNNPSKSWVVIYKATNFSERILNPDGSSSKTFTDAIESYQNRTKNCVVGVMDAPKVEHILDKKLNWDL